MNPKAEKGMGSGGSSRNKASSSHSSRSKAASSQSSKLGHKEVPNVSEIKVQNEK